MERPRIVATVECRMTSTRLPGKVMLKSCGKPMLQHIAERLSRVPKIDQLVLATTTNPTDDCIAALAREKGVGCFRGSEDMDLPTISHLAQAFHAPVRLSDHNLGIAVGPLLWGLAWRRSILLSLAAFLVRTSLFLGTAGIQVYGGGRSHCGEKRIRGKI